MLTSFSTVRSHQRRVVIQRVELVRAGSCDEPQKRTVDLVVQFVPLAHHHLENARHIGDRAQMAAAENWELADVEDRRSIVNSRFEHVDVDLSARSITNIKLELWTELSMQLSTATDIIFWWPRRELNPRHSV